MYEWQQKMWDSMYTTPELSDIAMGLIRPEVLDIRGQNGYVVQCFYLPKLKSFPACKEHLGKMKEKFAALEAWQDPEDSILWSFYIR
jgi:hypothetical protein